ncbi:MAG: hypothetical protein AABY64_05260 [Bdellovibrionota bacterium]
MNKKLIKFVFSFLLIVTVGCSSKKENADVEARVIKIDDLQKDFKIPTSLWKAFVAEESHATPAPSGGEGEHGGGGGASDKASFAKESQIVFVPMKVHFIEKNEGVLKSRKLTIELPRGGGQIDMADWTTDESGTFYIKFEMNEPATQEEMKVFFLSQARKRKIENEVLGMGCNKFVELGSSYKAAMKGFGLSVNTTRNRHLTVTGGRWFFVALEGGKTYISQVTITDANQKDLFCGD